MAIDSKLNPNIPAESVLARSSAAFIVMFQTSS